MIHYIALLIAVNVGGTGSYPWRGFWSFAPLQGLLARAPTLPAAMRFSEATLPNAK
jgi:hypothetical protein